MRVVDVHAHFIPMEFVDLLRSGEGPTGIDAVDREGKDPLIVHDNGLRYPLFPMFHDIAAKLEQMDRDGIDVTVMSIAPTLFFYWVDQEEALAAAQALNDAGARHSAASGGRIRMMATVPMNDPDAAARELRRAHDELGLVGVEIGTSVGEVQLDDPSLEPFFAEAEELEMPIMLHPYLSMISQPAPPVEGYHLSNVVGNPFETFAAAARLIVGGVFDRHPGLTVLLVHGGGALPYQIGRLEHAYRVRDETSAVVERNPLSYLHNFLFDTVVYERASLSYLLELVGDERVVFGSDIPFDMADTSPLSEHEQLAPQAAERVLGENAVKAFRLNTRG